MIRCFFPFAALLLAGCGVNGSLARGQHAVYRGDDSQLAELSLEAMLLADSAGDIFLDGRLLTDLSSILVLPGEHSIAADCGMVWTPSRPKVEYVFKAATRYRLVCDGHAPKVVLAE